MITTLRRFEQTEDLSQNAAMRLHRALEQVRPAACRILCLAALKIRQELQDQARHYFGVRRGGEGKPRTPTLTRHVVPSRP